MIRSKSLQEMYLYNHLYIETKNICWLFPKDTSNVCSVLFCLDACVDFTPFHSLYVTWLLGVSPTRRLCEDQENDIYGATLAAMRNLFHDVGRGESGEFYMNYIYLHMSYFKVL